MSAEGRSAGWEYSHDPTFDRWLRFDPDTEAVYEAERGAERVRHLYKMILLGLLFYNLFNFSAFYLMPDIFWPSVMMRVFGVTTLSLLIMYLIPHVSPTMRERMMLAGMCLAHASLVLLFRLTNAPLGLFAYSELDLTLVYAGLVLTLRLRHLLVFIGFGFVLSLAAILTKPGVPEGLTAAFSLQMASASIFVVISNYVVETRRCQAFVDTLRARGRAHSAETETLQMERRSLTDPLTGLPNRRAMDQRIDAAFADPQQEVVILIVDIDHFKPFNDTLGHVEGDRCLKAIGGTLATVAAEHDAFCARFGGEEFVFLMTGKPHFDVLRIANGLVRQVQSMAYPHPGRKDGLSIVTVSLGASLREAGQAKSIMQVMNEADEALYQAKRRGRNRFQMSTGIEQRVLTL